ncbi:energy-coupling factor transporter transmembrane protein EcfT [Breoghania sp.]|uniref:energy-coupling factor transporter transmembrane component T family protein n=1 Tax=Breoghania sp. TaxID=2065378 RepID=UPI002AA9199A|nr:energy-coupling factor transporter transmembrane protein EcfT [Breoghania sp.]
MMAGRDPAAVSLIHRIGAGPKLLTLAVAGTVLVIVGQWWWLALALAVILALYRFAGLSFAQAYKQIRPLLWILVILFAFQVYWESWNYAALVVLRIAALVLLAALVTLTTRTDALISAVETGLHPLKPLGVDPAKVGLAFSLALRFIPVIAAQAREIRDAQRARGLGTNPIALALPLVLRTLRMAGDVADAIEARSPYSDDDELPPRFAVDIDKSHSRKSCPDNEPPLETSSI